jgi:hypothetical protein
MEKEEKHDGLTDRDLLVGLTELVLSLAEKITGNKPMMRLFDSKGRHYNISPGHCIRWEPSTKEVQEVSAAQDNSPCPPGR